MRLRELALGIRSGALSVVDHVEQVLTRLTNGHWRGPLPGIPVAVKDLIDIAGTPTGSRLRT